MTWQKLIDKQEKEKAAFLEKYGKRGISRIKGARELNISLTYMTKLINKYNVNWPTQESIRNGSGISKAPDGLNTYLQLAKDGFSQAEVCPSLEYPTKTCKPSPKNIRLSLLMAERKEPLGAPDLPKKLTTSFSSHHFFHGCFF